MASIDELAAERIFKHPAMIALMAVTMVQRQGGNLDGADLLHALEQRCNQVGVTPYSDTFDRAADLAGMPYCRQLDIYCDRELRDWANSKWPT